jgi:hypothetical protein
MEAVDAEHPNGSLDYKNNGYTVLQQHVAFFDRNNDGVIYPWETFSGECRSSLQVKSSHVWNTVCCNITDDDSVCIQFERVCGNYYSISYREDIIDSIKQGYLISIMYKSLHECFVWLKMSSSTIPNKRWFYQCQYLWGVLAAALMIVNTVGHTIELISTLKKNWVPCSEYTLLPIIGPRCTLQHFYCLIIASKVVCIWMLPT